MSIGKVKKFLVPDLDSERTVWGRIDQGRRELAVQLRKDVSVEKLAELIGRAGPSLQGWKKGSRPKRESLEALEKLFVSAGLYHYTARYLDWGPEAEERPDLVAHDRSDRGEGPDEQRKGA